jgi:hypothetical protein
MPPASERRQHHCRAVFAAQRVPSYLHWACMLADLHHQVRLVDRCLFLAWAHCHVVAAMHPVGRWDQILLHPSSIHNDSRCHSTSNPFPIALCMRRLVSGLYLHVWLSLLTRVKVLLKGSDDCEAASSNDTIVYATHVACFSVLKG